jgi:lysozyme
VGVGRNLSDVGLSPDEIDLLFEHDLARATATARSLFNGFDALDPPRQAVLINMAFNLGPNRLAGFITFRARVQLHDWAGAKREMLDSKWAEQVGKRAQRLAEQMLTGVEV